MTSPLVEGMHLVGQQKKDCKQKTAHKTKFSVFHFQGCQMRHVRFWHVNFEFPFPIEQDPQTGQWMLMKRGMATSRLYMKREDMGSDLKSWVAVYLVELVRILLQYKWGTIFLSEWFWRMDELTTKRNGKAFG